MKREYIFILILLVLAFPIFTQVLIGDVNEDGNINITDALLVAQYYVGLNPQAFTASMEAGDTNASGTVEILDALLIARYYVGLISELPWPPKPPTSYIFPYAPYEYEYGLPSVSADQDADNAYIGNMCAEYELYKEDYVTSSGATGFLRVRWPDYKVPSGTTSTCMGNGMLFAVYMDDYHMFDSL